MCDCDCVCVCAFYSRNPHKIYYMSDRHNAVNSEANRLFECTRHSRVFVLDARCSCMYLWLAFAAAALSELSIFHRKSYFCFLPRLFYSTLKNKCRFTVSINRWYAPVCICVCGCGCFMTTLSVVNSDRMQCRSMSLFPNCFSSKLIFCHIFYLLPILNGVRKASKIKRSILCVAWSLVWPLVAHAAFAFWIV